MSGPYICFRPPSKLCCKVPTDRGSTQRPQPAGVYQQCTMHCRVIRQPAKKSLWHFCWQAPTPQIINSLHILIKPPTSLNTLTGSNRCYIYKTERPHKPYNWDQVAYPTVSPSMLCGPYIRLKSQRGYGQNFW